MTKKDLSYVHDWRNVLFIIFTSCSLGVWLEEKLTPFSFLCAIVFFTYAGNYLILYAKVKKWPAVKADLLSVKKEYVFYKDVGSVVASTRVRLYIKYSYEYDGSSHSTIGKCLVWYDCLFENDAAIQKVFQQHFRRKKVVIKVNPSSPNISYLNIEPSVSSKLIYMTMILVAFVDIAVATVRYSF